MLHIEAQVGNIDAVLKTLRRMESGALPNTKEAVKTATEYVQQEWIRSVSGVQVQYSGGVFRVKVVTGEYIRSIQEGLRYPAMGDAFTGEVATTSPHGRIVEEGIRPFDIKRGLLTSSKAKISADGKGKYITVAFRHNTPGNDSVAEAMPQHIYSEAKQLMYSRKNGILRKWWTGQQYSWGGNIGNKPEGMQSKLTNQGGNGYRGGKQDQYTWQTGKYSGMVKMGKPKNTSYMTFRRISTNSDPKAWLHPGVPPRPVRAAVIENTKNQVIDLIRSGFELDLLGL